jgi:hypothetical protein
MLMSLDAKDGFHANWRGGRSENYGYGAEFELLIGGGRPTKNASLAYFFDINAFRT